MDRNREEGRATECKATAGAKDRHAADGTGLEAKGPFGNGVYGTAGAELIGKVWIARDWI